jgi:hypothetical protein
LPPPVITDSTALREATTHVLSEVARQSHPALRGDSYDLAFAPRDTAAGRALPNNLESAQASGIRSSARVNFKSA